MDKNKIAHDIACAALPIVYEQYINNGGNRDDYDIVAEYNLLFSNIISDERLDSIKKVLNKD